MEHDSNPYDEYFVNGAIEKTEAPKEKEERIVRNKKPTELKGYYISKFSNLPSDMNNEYGPESKDDRSNESLSSAAKLPARVLHTITDTALRSRQKISKDMLHNSRFSS